MKQKERFITRFTSLNLYGFVVSYRKQFISFDWLSGYMMKGKR